MISKSTIDAVFATVRIDEVVSDFVSLKKRGVNMIALCPFHNEKTPSFTVSPAKGIYKCFGCGAGGNAVKFIMEHEKYSYPEALRFLAKKYNIAIEEDKQSDEDTRSESEHQSMYVVLSYAQQHFAKNLRETDEGKAIGLSYLKERGFKENTIEKFQLGYALDQWDGFTKAALKNAYQVELLGKTGLTISKEGKDYDRFRGRVMFPIHNLTGKVLGFGGRILMKDAKAAKYINSPESDLYQKSKILYGIYFAQKSIRAEDSCYLVEGYTDVISLHQAGIENVVASSGTSLTTGQIRLIKRSTKNIIILYDGDAAGIKASFRGIDLILEEGMNVKVVLFPDGEDPDSYAKKVSNEELKQFITDNAKDFIDFKTNLLLEETKNDPIKKTSLIRDIVETIAVIPDAIARSIFVQECSKNLNISEQSLINELNKIRRKKLEQKRREAALGREEQDVSISPTYAEALPAGQAGRQGSAGKLEDNGLQDIEDNTKCKHQEKDIIRILLNYGNNQFMLDDEVEGEDGKSAKDGEEIKVSVTKFIVNEIAVVDQIKFDNATYQEIFDEFSNSIDKNSTIDQQYFINHPEESISKMAIDLISTPYTLSENWEKKHRIHVQTEEADLKQSVERSVYSLKLVKLNKMISTIREKIRDAATGDDKTELLQEHQYLLELKVKISKHLGRVVY